MYDFYEYPGTIDVLLMLNYKVMMHLYDIPRVIMELQLHETVQTH